MAKSKTDDVYAYALSKALTNVSSPATVGLYSSCQDRLKRILKQMNEYMDREASSIEEHIEKKRRPRPVKPSFSGFLTLICRLFFYRPVWTKENQHNGGIRFIYVHFSAWHFAGSDLLWAGIAIRLFQAMQMNFGKLPLALYRVVQHDEDEEVKKQIQCETDGQNYWKSKKICCCPLWLFILSIIVLLVAAPVFLLVYGLPKATVKTDEDRNEENGQIDVLDGLLIGSLGVPAASFLRYAFLIGKNLIFSQDRNITKGMDNDQISSQLGFMNEVRKEIWFISRFIQFMEVFERRRIRVVLKITHLDRCSPKKIVAVLDAINILLSDEESPFISILAVNPDVLLEKVNSADGCFSKEDRAYALLNHIVTLAFTVPPLSRNLKSHLFHSLTNNSGQKSESSSHDPFSVKVEQSEDQPLIEINKAALDVKEEEVKDWVGRILTHSEKKLNKYMLDDAISMRRVINSIRVTVIIMKALDQDLPQPETVAAWVVLANQWPCRLSWIVQCVEDDKQRADIDQTTPVNHSKTMWEIFNESRGELYLMSSEITDLLQQDGDPELFEELLKDDDFQFTINNLETFQKAMVNLDQSIRNQLAHIRGTSRLKDSGWMTNLAPLPITTIIKMSTTDLCKEMERMKYDRKYIDKVNDNKINGSALVFGDAEDLKGLLDMTFGEWVTFRLHFLSLPSYLRAQYRNILPAQKSHPHVPHHSSSHPGLVNGCV